MRWHVLLTFLMALCVLLLLLAIQGRYMLVGAGETAAVYRLDRWTGEVQFILGKDAYRVTLKGRYHQYAE